MVFVSIDECNDIPKEIVKGNVESYLAIRRLGLGVTPFYFVTKFAMRLPQFFRRPETSPPAS